MDWCTRDLYDQTLTGPPRLRFVTIGIWADLEGISFDIGGCWARRGNCHVIGVARCQANQHPGRYVGARKLCAKDGWLVGAFSLPGNNLAFVHSHTKKKPLIHNSQNARYNVSGKMQRSRG